MCFLFTLLGSSFTETRQYSLDWAADHCLMPMSEKKTKRMCTLITFKKNMQRFHHMPNQRSRLRRPISKIRLILLMDAKTWMTSLILQCVPYAFRTPFSKCLARALLMHYLENDVNLLDIIEGNLWGPQGLVNLLVTWCESYDPVVPAGYSFGPWHY